MGFDILDWLLVSGAGLSRAVPSQGVPAARAQQQKPSQLSFGAIVDMLWSCAPNRYCEK